MYNQSLTGIFSMYQATQMIYYLQTSQFNVYINESSALLLISEISISEKYFLINIRKIFLDYSSFGYFLLCHRRLIGTHISPSNSTVKQMGSSRSILHL